MQKNTVQYSMKQKFRELCQNFKYISQQHQRATPDSLIEMQHSGEDKPNISERKAKINFPQIYIFTDKFAKNFYGTNFNKFVSIFGGNEARKRFCDTLPYAFLSLFFHK